MSLTTTGAVTGTPNSAIDLGLSVTGDDWAAYGQTNSESIRNLAGRTPGGLEAVFAAMTNRLGFQPATVGLVVHPDTQVTDDTLALIGRGLSLFCISPLVATYRGLGEVKLADSPRLVGGDSHVKLNRQSLLKVGPRTVGCVDVAGIERSLTVADLLPTPIELNDGAGNDGGPIMDPRAAWNTILEKCSVGSNDDAFTLLGNAGWKRIGQALVELGIGDAPDTLTASMLADGTQPRMFASRALYLARRAHDDGHGYAANLVRHMMTLFAQAVAVASAGAAGGVLYVQYQTLATCGSDAVSWVLDETDFADMVHWSAHYGRGDFPEVVLIPGHEPHKLETIGAYNAAKAMAGAR